MRVIRSRVQSYSPNHIGNDAAIFNVVAEQLRKRGCEVNIYSEEQFIAGAAQERIISIHYYAFRVGYVGAEEYACHTLAGAVLDAVAGVYAAGILPARHQARRNQPASPRRPHKVLRRGRLSIQSGSHARMANSAPHVPGATGRKPKPKEVAIKLRAICAKCSEVLDVKIYGGDCIVSPEGDIRIIDFND